MKIQFTKDKLQHALVGIVIFIIVSLTLGKVIGFLAVILAAFGKEFYDKNIGKTGFDKLDIGFTIAGGAIGLLLSLIL